MNKIVIKFLIIVFYCLITISFQGCGNQGINVVYKYDAFGLVGQRKRQRKRVKSAYGLTDIILINNCLVDRLSADLIPLDLRLKKQDNCLGDW